MSDEDIVNEQWDAKVIEHPTHPFILIDNYYNEEEEKVIWKELDFYNSIPKEAMDRAEHGLVAHDEDGQAKSKAYRHYISNIYDPRYESYSSIVRFLYKGRTKQFWELVKQCMPYGRSYLSSNVDSSMVSYYEQDDHYKPHHDTSLWTACTWFVRERRLFDGGDFDFPESGCQIKLKHNRSVYFPSCYLHHVSPIKFHTKPEEIGYGRFTITHFYNYNPINDKRNEH